MNGERCYRTLLFLYPRSFRRTYATLMVQLFRDQRRDRGRSRAWLTTGRDLFTTVPARNLEAFMTMSPQGKLVAAAIATTLGILLVAAIGGGFAALILMLLLAWILTSLLRQRGAVPPRGYWWKLIASGVGVFAVAFAVFAPPWPESWRSAVPGEVAWTIGFFAFAISIVLVAAGALTGLAQWSGRRHAA
jgi:hypothetical protein